MLTPTITPPLRPPHLFDPPRVHQRPARRQPEHQRRFCARLGPRGHRADLHEPEPERPQPGHRPCVLVEPGRQPDRPGKLQPERPHPQHRIARPEPPPEHRRHPRHRRHRPEHPDQPEPAPVRRLGRYPPQHHPVKEPVHRLTPEHYPERPVVLPPPPSPHQGAATTRTPTVVTYSDERATLSDIWGPDEITRGEVSAAGGGPGPRAPAMVA